MKTFVLSFIMISVSLGAFAQDDAQNCKEAVLPFLPAFEGYYLDSYCKFSESFSYDFAVARNSRSVHKEGVYREVWYKRNPDNSKHISGPQILKQQADAIKAAGGVLAPDSDGDVFIITYQGKEFWILINANTYSEDQDNYGVISVEVEGIKQEPGSQNTIGTMGTPGPPGPAGPQGPQGASGSGVGTQVHTIGEHYGGGIVFYVYDNGQHGLIAATISQGTGIAGFHSYTMARSDGVGAGRINTAIIVASQGRGTGIKYAALLCIEYSVTDLNGFKYGDWYLPSIFELNLMYLRNDVIEIYPMGTYYSSTEDFNGNLLYLNFRNGIQGSGLGMEQEFAVRAIRSF